LLSLLSDSGFCDDAAPGKAESMRAYSLDFRKKKVEAVKKGVPKGVPKSETAWRFGVNLATLK
jgi:hypothetical protein